MRKIYLLVLGLMVSLWTNAFTVIDRNGIEYEVSESGSGQAVITGRIPSKFVKVLTAVYHEIVYTFVSRDRLHF